MATEEVGISRPIETPTTSAGRDDVQLTAAGEHGKGEFRCVQCSYGITVYRELPTCPMCGGESWQPVSWRPFGHVDATTPSR